MRMNISLTKEENVLIKKLAKEEHRPYSRQIVHMTDFYIKNKKTIQISFFTVLGSLTHFHIKPSTFPPIWYKNFIQGLACIMLAFPVFFIPLIAALSNPVLRILVVPVTTRAFLPFFFASDPSRARLPGPKMSFVGRRNVLIIGILH